MIGFYFITDRKLSKNGILQDAEDGLLAGARVIQYREKEKNELEMVKEALGLRRITNKFGALLIVNDNVKVALASDADGVHLGQEDGNVAEARKLLRGKIIGVTVHDVKEAVKAEKEGADYLGVSPIFATSTKSDAGAAIGVDGLKRIRAKVKLPIVAIGGIDLGNAHEVIAAGADGICAISAVSGEGVVGKVGKFAALFSHQ